MTLHVTGQLRHHRSGDTLVGLWSATLALRTEEGSRAPLGVALLLAISIPLVMTSWLLKYLESRVDHRARHYQAAHKPVLLTTRSPQRRPASQMRRTGNNASGGTQAPSVPQVGSQDPRAHPVEGW